MNAPRVWSQGDLIIIEEEIPKGAQEIPDHDGVFAHGEATGHAHRIVKGKAQFFRDEEKTRAWALTDLQVGHEDHPGFLKEIPAGTQFRYYQEREADWINKVNRNVED